MSKLRKLTDTQSVAVDLIKAVAIFSVIAAHVNIVVDYNPYVRVISSLWGAFSKVGVVFFFVIGGYFYSRKENDSKTFWSKKFFRLILPWLVCSTMTYWVRFLDGEALSISMYLKWIFGVGTWYYYIVMYLFFLLVFRLFYKNDGILYFIVIAHFAIICANTCGFSFTPSVSFITDYLNPLYWMGYFSLGILIRRKEWDVRFGKNRWLLAVSIITTLMFLGIIICFEINTYFSIVTYMFALASLFVVANICYLASKYRASTYIRKIGTSSYCIYLLHMQIVQQAMLFIPDGNIKVILAPVMGLVLMVVFICVCSLVLNKIPYGEKIKMIIGL